MDFLLSMVKKELVGEQALYNVGHDLYYILPIVNRCVCSHTLISGKQNIEC